MSVVAGSTPTGEMLLAMRPVLRVPHPATASATTPDYVAPRSRFSKPLQWEALGVVAAIGILQLALCAAPAQAQAPDNGGLSTQSNEPVQITPAPRNPSSNSAPLAPIFPQSSPPAAAAPRTPRYAIPTGPSSGAGLGFGPIRPGDIVEVQ